MTLLHLASEEEYRNYFFANFCVRPLKMVVGAETIDIYFERGAFGHAFYESSNRDGNKDQFSLPRATHMGLIPQMLSDSEGDRRAGWDSKRKSYDHSHCVTIAAGDFVLVIRIRRTRTGIYRGKFVTCYVADTSIHKIRTSPAWDFEETKKSL